MDLTIVEQLVESSTTQGSKIVFQQIDKKYEEDEHSLEMHLPYIRKMFETRMQDSSTDIKIIPLMVGQIPDDDYSKYAQVLVPYFTDDRTLFVISSDFCHWGERFKFTHKYENFDEVEIYKSIEQLDKFGIQQIEMQSLAGFQQYLKDTKNTICGRNPIQLLLAIIEEAGKQEANVFSTEFVKYD